MCLLFSSLFHIWVGKSSTLHRMLLRLDLAGICLIIGGSFCPIVYYGFYCHPHLRTAYLATAVGIPIAGMLLMVFSNLMVDHRYRILRSAILAAIAFSGLVPFLHLLHLVPIGAWGSGLLIGFSVYVAGGCIYASQIPERWRPGAFDHGFHSHALFHACVVAAALIHYRTFAQLYAWRALHSCPVQH